MANVGGSTFITADHGNLDEMIDHEGNRSNSHESFSEQSRFYSCAETWR